MASESREEGLSLTVRFNVGGTKYEVSRSLLSQHQDTVLARMASATWQRNPHIEIFVERDGGRFKFVLDYMRDGQVILPASGQVSKESLLNELMYFGFDTADPSRIKVEFAHLEEPMPMSRITADHIEKMQELYNKRDKLDIEISANIVAHACCVRYTTTGNLNVIFSAVSDDHLDLEVSDAVECANLFNDAQETLIAALNRVLAKYGFRAAEFQISHRKGEPEVRVDLSKHVCLLL
ncbi:BTB/POZ domain-containing protein [Seminavis robusta]|uniref:BTB/POZ domain-containing protein n=1 Tax=Seminavis robusta TaxID=568900 RepID=A0A9N8DVM7_9STRA|nr:BTB/POZ domain-containing protein [Seminavis robusta]|eukprot:Sro309_g113860.1 BTB/POZ domain-containing protein (237) ;mRNA; f:50057-50767